MKFVPFWKRIKDSINGLHVHPLMLLDLPHEEWPHNCWVWTGAKNGREGTTIRTRANEGEIVFQRCDVKPLGVIHNPVTDRTELVHRILFEALIRGLKSHEFLRKNTELCNDHSCVNPLHWMIVRHKERENERSGRMLGQVRLVVEAAGSEIEELCDLIEQEFGINEPATFAELRHRPTMIDWTDEEITTAIRLLGGHIEGKML